MLSGWQSAAGQSTELSPTPVLMDHMDGDKVALRLRNTIPGMQVSEHGITRQIQQHGNGAEQIRFRCPPGQSAQWVYAIPVAPIIGELRVTASIHCNRPGTRLGAVVVLPRSQNPSTGTAYQILVRGQEFAPGNNWHELALQNLEQEVHRQVRVARMQYGSPMDEREAYVAGIVILAPGGQGLTELLVDRVQVFGVLNPQQRNPSELLTIPSTNKPTHPAKDPFVDPRGSVGTSSQEMGEPLTVIQWQGEPLEFLAKLGFDGVRMGRPPNAEESAQAKQLGLALICPPPSFQQLSSQGIDDELDAVSLWDLGKHFAVDELQLAGRWQELLKRHDSKQNRRTVVSGKSLAQAASRIGDTVLLERPLFSSSLSWKDYATWLGRHERLVRRGTPIWTSIETQLQPVAAQQASALCPNSAKHQSTSYPQLVVATSVAVGANSQGFWFSSHTPLNGKEPNSQYRALSLELLNLRLGLARHWLTQGELQASARSTIPDLTALVLKVERSHLLLPVPWSTKLQSLNQTVHPGPLSFVVPGGVESSQAYLLTMGGSQRLRHERVTGGIRISLDELPLDGFLLLTDDQQAFSQMSKYLRHYGQRAAEIRYQLAEYRFQQMFQVFQHIGSSLRTAKRLQELLGRSQRELQTCKRNIASNNHQLAYRHAYHVEQTLDQCEVLIRSEVHPVLPFGLASLPEQLQLAHNLKPVISSTPLLPGGEFEDLDVLLEAGWRYQKLDQPELHTEVRLSPSAPYSGRYCLEMEARPVDHAVSPGMASTAPIWITSASAHVQSGDLIQITGYAKVPQKLLGSVDGLQIIDSLGGEELALNIPVSPTWKPFRLIRAAPCDTEVKVTLALTGIGTAQIDDLQIHLLRNAKRPHTLQARNGRDDSPR